MFMYVKICLRLYFNGVIIFYWLSFSFSRVFISICFLYIIFKHISKQEKRFTALWFYFQVLMHSFCNSFLTFISEFISEFINYYHCCSHCTTSSTSLPLCLGIRALARALPLQVKKALKWQWNLRLLRKVSGQ